VLTLFVPYRINFLVIASGAKQSTWLKTGLLRRVRSSQ
jgi:hypothetical protein